MPYLLEVIACSPADAAAAQAGGANRLELCSRLDLRGLTMPAVEVAGVLRVCTTPVRVMLRPSDTFVATEAEFGEMEREVRALAGLPIEGVILGFLDAGGSLDFRAMDRVLCRAPSAWGVTLHTAFDYARGELEDKFESIRRHGRFDRILTASGPDVLARLNRLTDDRLRIIAGGGLTLENLAERVGKTGCLEFHVGRAARTPETTTAPVDCEKVRRLRSLLDTLSSQQSSLAVRRQ